MTKNQRISAFLDTLFENGLSESQQSVVLSADTSLVGGANTCINQSSTTCTGENSGCTNYGYCGDKNSGCLNKPALDNQKEETCGQPPLNDKNCNVPSNKLTCYNPALVC